MEMKFDPMTGQPIQPQPQQDAVRFDPMTGQPIQPQPQPQPQGAVTGYDPMTGQPIYAGSGTTFTAAPAAKAGIGIGVKIGIAAAVVAVVAVGTTVFAGVRNGAFLSPAGKVELAVSNTLSDGPELLEDLNASSILESKNYTLGMEASYSGQKVSVEFRSSEKKKQLEAAVDTTLVYYYTKDNDGALIDAMGEDTVNQINDLLKGAEDSGAQDEFIQTIQDEFDSLEYEKISAETFEVDGKDRKCKGYATTVSGDNLNNILDAYMDYIEACMPDSLSQYWRWDNVSELQDEFADMDDLNVSFFIYKNKLACIRIDEDGDDPVEIQFQGGDYRLQNVELVVDGKTYMKLSGEKDGLTETIKLKAAGETVFKAEYDTKSGDFDIEVSKVTVSGNVESSRKGVTLTISQISSLDGLKLTIYAQEDADFADVEKKDLFDVGNADESDFYDLMDDIDTDVIEDYMDLFGYY
jgi:hypothetical protein